MALAHRGKQFTTADAITKLFDALCCGFTFSASGQQAHADARNEPRPAVPAQGRKGQAGPTNTC
jgi:hypothetical protein